MLSINNLYLKHVGLLLRKDMRRSLAELYPRQNQQRKAALLNRMRGQMMNGNTITREK